jgi:hypothetical protein
MTAPTTLRNAEVGIEVFERDRWTPELLDALYALATSMSAEERANFDNHAWTNDCVHLFRAQPSGALAGFQFWCSGPSSRPGRRVIIGGKLRVLPEYRRKALHLRSALSYYSAVGRAHPDDAIERVSLASLFGFVAIAGALHEYRFIAEDTLAADARWLCDVVAERAAHSGYRYERQTGVVHVAIRPTAAQLGAYPADYYETPLARAYRARNPEFRTNGCYLAFGFPLSAENLQAIAAAIARKLAR